MARYGEYEIGQEDSSDKWYVFRGDHVVAGPFYDKVSAIDARDWRNMAAEEVA